MMIFMLANEKRTLSQILKTLMKEKGITIRTLYEGSGVATATIQRIRSGVGNPTIENLEAIARFLKVSVSELVGESSLSVKAEVRAESIPLFTWTEVLHLQAMRAIHHETISVVDLEISEEAFALQVSENLNHLFLKGAVMVVDPKAELLHKSFVIVYKEGGVLPSLKQLLIHDDVKVLKPLMDGFPAQVLDSQFSIIGVVVQTFFNLKTNTLDI